MVSIVFVSWRSSLKCIRITARLLGYETGVDIPTYVVRNNAKSLLKRYNRLPTGAYSVEDGRVTDDDSETRQGEAKQEEKHLGRSAKAGVQVHHQREFQLQNLPSASRLIVQVKVSRSSPRVPHTDSSGGTCN